ncbi:MAG TPA: hypothetical protein VKY90_06215 [Candidatus Dormibacteraeota bacterium]|nr:hypothetical protein [Candidatus Dormibacteraeota bacterium]
MLTHGRVAGRTGAAVPGPTSARGIEKLVGALSLDLTMRTPLGVQVEEAKRAITQLSEQQPRSLDGLRRRR